MAEHNEYMTAVVIATERSLENMSLYGCVSSWDPMVAATAEEYPVTSPVVQDEEKTLLPVAVIFVEQESKGGMGWSMRKVSKMTYYYCWLIEIPLYRRSRCRVAVY